MIKFMFFTLILLVAGLGAFAADLTDITWIGQAGADLATASNWSPAPAKNLSDSSGNGYRLVFAGDATPVISNADKVYCGEIKVTSGNVKVTRTINNGRFIVNNTTYSTAAATRMTIDVAEGATLQIGESGTLVAVNNSGADRTYVKSGRGKLTIWGSTSNMNLGWEIDGTLELGAATGASSTACVKTGATFKLLAGNIFNHALVVDVAAGAVFDMGGQEAALTAVTGAGVVRNGTLTLFLEKGPHLFSGKFEDMTGAITLLRYGGTNVRATTEDEFGFIVGAADTLALPGDHLVIKYDQSVTDQTLFDPTKCALRFAPGIGEFYCVTNSKIISRMKLSQPHPIYCADTNGNPITLHTTLKEPTERSHRFTGPGSLVAYAIDGNPDTVTLTNDIISVRGTLAQAIPGGTLNLGNGVAAQDFDFTKPAALEARAGTIAFNNASSVTYDGPLTGAGNFMFNKGGTVSNLGLDGGTLTLKGDTTVTGGRSVFHYGSGALNFEAENLTLTVSGGDHMGERASSAKEPYYAPLPRGILMSGTYKTSATLHLTGGDMVVRDNYSYGVKTYLLDGGRLHLTGTTLTPNTPSAITASNPKTFTFNGGEFVISAREGIGGNNDVPLDVFPDDSRLVLNVGDGGLRLDDEYVYAQTQYYDVSYALNRQLTKTGTGGVRQRGYGGWVYKYALPIDGTFEGEGSLSTVPTNDEARATANFFGAGDMILRNHQLVLSNRKTDYSFTPHGPGKKLTVGGGSMLALRQAAKDGKATVAINELAFEEGGALFLLDYGTVGTGSKITLASAPSVSSAGRVRLPIFANTRTYNVSMPLKYDENGFKAFETTDCTTDFSQGGVCLVEKTRTLSSGASLDMLIVGHNGALTLSDGVTATIGDGTGPSVLSIGVAEIAGGTGSALSFNDAAGLIVCGVNGASGVFYADGASSVRVPITHANGLSVVSLPDIYQTGWRGVRLGAANTYSGATRVGSAIIQAEHPNCFSTGDVYTIPGKCFGGGIRLAYEGGVWNNNFHLSGQGIRDRRWDRREYCETGFALGFSRNGTVAGNVTIDRFARMTTSTNPVTGTISGVVSGGKLEIYQSSGAIRLTNANTYTDGTDVVDSTLELGRGTSAGTGEIWLSNGTLRFVNTEPITFANRIVGVGTIEIAGAPVTFTDETMGAYANKVLAKGTTLDFPDFKSVTEKTALVVSGSVTLASDVTVSELWGSGSVAGATVTVTGEIQPGGAGAIGTLTLDRAPVTTSATKLVIEDSDGAMDRLTVGAALDLTNLALEFRLLTAHCGREKKTIVSATQITGEFASVTKTPKKAERIQISTEETAVFAVPASGFILFVR